MRNKLFTPILCILSLFFLYGTCKNSAVKKNPPYFKKISVYPLYRCPIDQFVYAQWKITGSSTGVSFIAEIPGKPDVTLCTSDDLEGTISLNVEEITRLGYSVPSEMKIKAIAKTQNEGVLWGTHTEPDVRTYTITTITGQQVIRGIETNIRRNENEDYVLSLPSATWTPSIKIEAMKITQGCIENIEYYLVQKGPLTPDPLRLSNRSEYYARFSTPLPALGDWTIKPSSRCDKRTEKLILEITAICPQR